jgi:cyanate lyase
VTKAEAARAIQERMQAQGRTYAEVAAAIDRPLVWTAAALQGQHPFTHRDAKTVAELLALDDPIAATLTEIPMRGALDQAVPVDPTIYRLYEVLQVYGPALKALIHEEFGDGIMSAINFNADVERVEDPGGDRVRITLEGKFLPYQWG